MRCICFTMHKVISILCYLLARSTGKPDQLEEQEDGLVIESFYFNFGLFETRMQFSFKRK